MDLYCDYLSLVTIKRYGQYNTKPPLLQNYLRLDGRSGACFTCPRGHVLTGIRSPLESLRPCLAILVMMTRRSTSDEQLMFLDIFVLECPTVAE